VINDFLEPFRKRRALYEKDKGAILHLLKTGTERANQEAEKTLSLAKKAIDQDYFSRSLRLKN
jgi:tryptophanyl-tRNA synthetase